MMNDTKGSSHPQQLDQALTHPVWQLGIGDLFFFVGIASVVAFCYSQRWMTAEGFASTLIFGFIASIFFVFTSRRLSGVVLGIIGLASLGIGYVAAASIAWLHVISPLCAGPFDGKPATKKHLFKVSLCCLAVALLFSVMVLPSHLKRLHKARAEYPIVDLNPRLAYEEQKKTQPAKALTAETENNLRIMEQWANDSDDIFSRRTTLKLFHDKQHERFVRSLGFGVVRMSPVREWLAESPDPQSIGFNPMKTSPNEDKSDDGAWTNWERIFRHQNDSIDLTNLSNENHFHFLNVKDFVEPATFGYVAAPKQAAGFLAHAFHFPQQAPKNLELGKWKNEFLQLVSLEKFDEPRAYVLDALPRMDQLNDGNAETRALDNFEKRSLGQLESTSDIVIQEEENSIRMLGSLRANTSCLDCHSGQRGDLLGAFTYKFVRNHFSSDPSGTINE